VHEELDHQQVERNFHGVHIPLKTLAVVQADAEFYFLRLFGEVVSGFGR
jgi:hypothetical protein